MVGIISIATPLFISYRLVFYVSGMILMGLGIYCEKHLEVKSEPTIKQPLGKLAVLSFACAYVITLLPDYLFYNIGLGRYTLIVTLIIGALMIYLSYQLISIKQLSNITSSLTMIITGYVGYQLALLANSNLGELVKYTNRRFYYIPTHLIVMLGIVILITLFVINKKQKEK